MTQLVESYLDLSNLSSTHTKAQYLSSPNDVLQRCADHRLAGITSWDQALSAMACVVRWSPDTMFSNVAALCNCEGQYEAQVLQGIAFLGMSGLLVIGKAANEANKSYLIKRWTAYCESSSITNMLTQAGMEGMIKLIMGVQPRLHQTAVGRAWAKQAISNVCNLQGLKAQILMVYDFVDMKACQLMYKYLSTGPLVLVLPNVMEDARRFKAAYDGLKTTQGESDFPYTRLMGMGEELNHAKYPDLYYCAIGYYKYIGSIGGKDGKFIKSNLETKTEAAVLDRYYKISASGSGISEAHMAVWAANAAEVGGHVGEEDLKRAKRKLKSKHEESEDE